MTEGSCYWGVRWKLIGEPQLAAGHFPGDEYFDGEIEHLRKSMETTDWSHVRDVFSVGRNLGLIIAELGDGPAGPIEWDDLLRLQCGQMLRKFFGKFCWRPDLFGALSAFSAPPR